MKEKKIINVGRYDRKIWATIFKEVVNELNGTLLSRGDKKDTKGTEIRLYGANNKRGGYYQCDFGFEYEGNKYIVEFDGPGHYKENKKCLEDENRDKLAQEQGYRIIRLPYWLILSNEVFKHFFGFDCGCNIIPDFPNGFISDKLKNTPDYFCKRGLERFKKELNELPEQLRLEVIISLIIKSERFDDISLKDFKLGTEIFDEARSNPVYPEKYEKIKREILSINEQSIK
jgi:hypothetical protein